MKNSVTKNSTAACTLLLATSSAFAGGPTKSPSSGATVSATPPNIQLTKTFGIKSLTLASAEDKIQSCTVPKDVTRQNDPKPQRILSLAFKPKANHSATLKFDMSPIQASQDERVLIVFYSPCLSKTPQIKTPNSKQKLALDKQKMQVMANYPVPAVTAVKGNLATTRMSFEVNINTGFLAHQVNAGDDTFYLQAALLPKADLEKKNFKNVQLSSLQAIQITPNTCPTDAAFSQNLNSDNKFCKKLP
jgi:hypothetical protein